MQQSPGPIDNTSLVEIDTMQLQKDLEEPLTLTLTRPLIGLWFSHSILNSLMHTFP